MRNVWPAQGRWFVSNGRVTKCFDKLVSTIPVEDLLEALPDVPHSLRADVKSLRYNSLTLVMLGAQCDVRPPYTALYVPDMRFPFHRLSFPTNFTDEGAPEGCMAVAAEITTNPGDGFHELSDAEATALVLEGIAQMGLIDPARVRFKRVYRTKHAYVVRTFDYSTKLERVLKYIRDLGIISVGRNAEFEYINMDEAVRRAMDIVRQLDAPATARETSIRE